MTANVCPKHIACPICEAPLKNRGGNAANCTRNLTHNFMLGLGEVDLDKCTATTAYVLTTDTNDDRKAGERFEGPPMRFYEVKKAGT